MRDLDKATDILKKNIVNICTVSEWADLMGYSNVQYFSRKVRTKYRKPTSKILREKKLELICSLFRDHPDEVFFYVAVEAGFANEQSLSKFVKRATGKTLTEFKSECEVEELNGNILYNQLATISGKPKKEIVMRKLIFSKMIFSLVVVSFFLTSPEPKADTFSESCVYFRFDDGELCDPEGNTCIVITPVPPSGICEE